MKDAKSPDERYMALAIAEGLRAKAKHEWPFGAVVVQNGKVVARNHCRESNHKTVLAHAELLAVDDACKALGRNDLSDCVIYSTNEPCMMCSAAIFQAKIRKVVIGASRSDLPHLLRRRKLRIEDLAKDSGYKPTIVHGVLKDEVIAMFDHLKPADASPKNPAPKPRARTPKR